VADDVAADDGHARRAASWLLQVLAWAVGTLFIAGFTRAVRKA